VSVIMLTGYAALETAQEALRLGANDYLKKPFDTAEMRRVVQANVQRSAIERRRAQASRELHDLNSRLADQLASKEHLAALGQASAEFAHDVRNPLSIVQGYIDLLSRQIEGSRARLGDQFGETQDYLDIIEKNVRRCHELVETWQRLGKKDPKLLKNVCVSDLLRDVVKGSEPMSAEIGASVQFAGGSEGCWVHAEPIQIYRAVQNIVKNAIQALTGRGGVVSVGCRRHQGDVEIEVRDNGCGISPEQASRLFEPYYTTKTPGKGMGLGLFITKKIVEDYQGTISVESKVGGGTAVTIRLPASGAGPAAESAA
jgi:signal transduction histidine kinase